MKWINLILAGAVAASGILRAQTATFSTEPIGFNKVVCLKNSDTIVGIPFRQQGSLSTLMSGPPADVQGSPDLAVIPLQSLTLTPGDLTRHYLKFDGGSRDGRWYDITANTASSVTINLNGDNLNEVDEDNRVVIAEYWTLDTLFPPAQATTGWTENPENPGESIQNGHAIMASEGIFPNQLRSLLLLPDVVGTGINRSAPTSYFIHAAQWKAFGKGSEDFGNIFILPDSIITIRHQSTVPHNTVFRSHGEVVTANFTIPLHTNTATKRDIFIGLPRPVDLSLKDLRLWESGAFAKSDGIFPNQWRDMLLVFNNSQPSINKSAAVSYFHNGTNWLRTGDNATMNRDDDLIPAGAGFIIRKYSKESGETVFWNNPPSY